jgi:hypothetical protein
LAGGEGFDASGFGVSEEKLDIEGAASGAKRRSRLEGISGQQVKAVDIAAIVIAEAIASPQRSRHTTA